MNKEEEIYKIKDKVAIITGGGTGLGREVALQLAREGMKIAVNYNVSKEEANKTVEEIKGLGVDSIAIQANVAIVADVERMVDEAYNYFGHIDLLINNAGVTKLCKFENLDGLQEEDWDKILNINVKAPFFSSRAIQKYFEKNPEGGSIINTSSIAGINSVGSSIAYSASKAAMIHLTKCLAKAMAPKVRVNSVAPGFLDTRFSADQKELKRLAVELSPLKKNPSLQECATAYVYLAKNPSVTGQVIVVDGGLIV